MEKCTVTGKELNEDFKSGFITADFSPKELVQDAIIKEDYNDNIDIIMTNANFEECIITVKISEILTPSEHSEVLKLNEGI